VAEYERSVPTEIRKPTTEQDEYWLFAQRVLGLYPAHGELGGKWLLFVPVAQIDEVWDKVRASTEQGLLGGLSKVATSKPNPNAKNAATRVICVYTYDWTDREDVMRVREQLRELGFRSKISYKADRETNAGNYSGTTKGRVSQYYE
jgi:hypothetical protein